MPNWCSNRMTVYVPSEEVAGEVLRKVRGKDGEVICFHEIVPEPAIGWGLIDEPLDEYSWRVENWGTKWNAAHANVERSYDGVSLEFTFDTAWAPPEPVVIELSKLFPQCVVGLAYDEPGMDFGGYIFLKDGRSFEKMEGGSRWSTWADEMEGSFDRSFFDQEAGDDD